MLAAAAMCLLALLALLASVVHARRVRRRFEHHAGRLRTHRNSIALVRRRERLDDSSLLERHATLVREAVAPVLLTTPDGKILAASMGVLAMLGYDTEEELRRVRMGQLYVNPLDRSVHLDAVLRHSGRVSSSEFRMKRNDGQELCVLTTARVLVLNGVVTYEGVLTDVTMLRAAAEERRQLESRLHIASKLEVVGRLASGIAHEINTPMQFIGDNIAFLKNAFGRLITSPRAADPEWRADIEDALAGSAEGVARVSEIVSAMKEFAHPGDVDLASTDINAALRTTLVVARNEYKHVADVTLELGDIPPVDCRRAEMNKVFLNLVVNAAHAIESGDKHTGRRGTITIATQLRDEGVVIEVGDDGCGIPAAVLPKIFDPFFTTKAIGKGSGQGLAIARFVVRAHGGDLSVVSKVGHGTKFSITLPVAAASGSLSEDWISDPVDQERLIG